MTSCFSASDTLTVYNQTRNWDVQSATRTLNRCPGCLGLEKEVRPLVSGPADIPYSYRLDSNPIVDRTTKALLATKISFSRLDRNVPEQKLDLFQFAAS